jgi:uncharacterized protein YdeI (BOF family)
MKRVALLVLLLVALTVISSCAKKVGYGAPIKPDLNFVRIADILTDPKPFLDKEIGLEGKITLECGSGCWFQMNDGSGEILVDLAPASFAIPQMPNRTVTVMGNVVEDEERIVIHASGVRF